MNANNSIGTPQPEGEMPAGQRGVKNGARKQKRPHRKNKITTNRDSTPLVARCAPRLPAAGCQYILSSNATIPRVDTLGCILSPFRGSPPVALLFCHIPSLRQWQFRTARRRNRHGILSCKRLTDKETFAARLNAVPTSFPYFYMTEKQYHTDAAAISTCLPCNQRPFTLQSAPDYRVIRC